MRFASVEAIADAVLYEGYVLYPYRASAAKNRVRWQFGLLAPRPSDGDAVEPWFSQTECVVERGAAPRLTVRIRGLRPHLVEAEADASTAWLDGRPHTAEVAGIRLEDVGAVCAETLDLDGVAARVEVTAAPAGRYVSLRVRLENVEPWQPAFADRDRLLCRSLVSTHLLLALDDGAFVSMLEPPADAAALVAGCVNRHTWPVLAGPRGARDLLLSSPIVLYDYPAVAGESRAELCDGTEIDEILSLRIQALTDDEKREARATDPRARAIVDRVDAFTADDLHALHGTVRSADPFAPADVDPPEQAGVVVAGTRVAKGSRVRLRPTRRADAMDMFLRDQAATVAGIYRDLDDRVYVAVTIDADPAAALHESYGRFFYFDPAEVEPIVAAQEGT